MDRSVISVCKFLLAGKGVRVPGCSHQCACPEQRLKGKREKRWNSFGKGRKKDRICHCVGGHRGEEVVEFLCWVIRICTLHCAGNPALAMSA